MKRFFFSLLSALAISLVLSGSLWAASLESIGRVVALRGQVQATQEDGTLRALALKMPVYRQDRIQTGPRGRLQILFDDKTIVSLGPKSDMRIAEYRWQPEQQDGAMKTVVKEGVFRVMGGSITRVAPDQFTTETPSATIGIRGSMYAGRVSAEQTVVLFEGGRGIYVANPAGQVEISTPGFGTQVSDPQQPPQPPQRFEQEQLAEVSPEAADEEAEADSDDDSSQPEPAVNDGQEESAAGETDDDSTASAAEPTSAETEVLTQEAGDSFADQPAEAESVELLDDGLTTIEVSETTQDAIEDSSQLELNQEVVEETNASTPTDPTPTDPTPTDPTPTDPPVVDPPPTSAVFSGRSIQLLDDEAPALGPNDGAKLGDVFVSSDAGVLAGSLTADADGQVTSFAATIEPYDPTKTYDGVINHAVPGYEVNLVGATRTFSGFSIDSVNSGEFIVFGTMGETFVDGGITYKYADLGFAGPPTLNPLTSGTYGYHGPLFFSFIPTDSSQFEVETGSVDFAINFDNGKVFGILQQIDPAYPSFPIDSFIYGDVSGSTLTNLKMIEFGEVDPMFPGPPSSITGVGTFGQLYGEQTQGVGLVLDLNETDLQSQTSLGTGVILGAGFRDLTTLSTHTSGTTVWQGFGVGIAEDMSNPDINRRLFMNSFADDFSLTINRDSGTVTGTYSAPDVADSGYTVTSLEIGGAHGSAYINDKMLIAEMGGSAVIDNGIDAAAGLQPTGNLLVVEDPALQLLDYATWGYWEAVYADPAGGSMYHMHLPGSLWIAGERTTLSEVQSLIDTNFVGTYSGMAQGSWISASGTMDELTNGASNLTIDFAAAASLPVSGTLSFDQGVLDISGFTPVTTSGFNATVNSATQSAVNGAFYGPGAQTIGGDFDALMSTGERFIGIFGGNR